MHEEGALPVCLLPTLRAGVDLRPLASAGPAQQTANPAQPAGPQYYNVGVPPPQAQQVPTSAGVPYVATPNGQGQAFADLNLARQMLQAQDDQIRQQSAQLTQMGAMLTQALQLANQQAASEPTQLLQQPLARLLALRRERQVQDKQLTHRHQWMSTLVCAPGEQRVTSPPYLSSTMLA